MTNVAARALSSIHQGRRLAAIACGGAVVAGSSPAFARDTIDAGAKPYFIIGGIVAAILFFALGGFLLARGMRTMRLGAAARDWPTTPGTVISSEVAKKQGYNEGAYDYYSPEIRYAYTVGGAAYTGQTIKIGLTEVHYPTEAKAGEWLTRYPVGANPPVLYDPAKPEVSTLEAGQFSGGRLFFAGSLLLLVAIFAVWFTIWSALTPGE